MTPASKLKDGQTPLVVETSGKGTILTGIFLFAFLIAGGGAWAYYANLSGAIIAQGQVAILGKPKTIQHLDGGIVSSFGVSEGDRVKSGDLLVRLDDTLLRTNLDIYEGRLRESLALRARLRAERDNASSIVWDDKILKVLNVAVDLGVKEGQRKLFVARQERRQGQVSQLGEKTNQYNNQKLGIEALKTSKNTQVGMIEEELEGIRVLRKKKLTSKSHLMNMERQKEALIGQNAEHDAELSRVQNSISETEIQIVQIDREFQEAVLTELRQVEREVNETTQQLHSTIEQLRRVEIRAPVSGIVHEMSVFTIGGVIGPGTPVMQIIPQDDKFEIEANVEPQFVDELYPGQPTILRFSAFNQRTTPELNGAIKDVSANVVVNEQTGLSFYKVRVTVTVDELSRLNGLTLVPGMPVEAFVKTRERTVLNYLVKPLLDQINRAGREE